MKQEEVLATADKNFQANVSMLGKIQAICLKAKNHFQNLEVELQKVNPEIRFGNFSVSFHYRKVELTRFENLNVIHIPSETEGKNYLSFSIGVHFNPSSDETHYCAAYYSGNNFNYLKNKEETALIEKMLQDCDIEELLISSINKMVERNYIG